MAEMVEADIVLDTQEVHAVDGDAPGIGIVDGVADHVAIEHLAIQVEVDGVAADNSRLAHMAELSVLNAASCSSVHAAMDHKVRTILVLFALTISLDDDVPR